jgi:hypothetical protein
VLHGLTSWSAGFGHPVEAPLHPLEHGLVL